MLAGGVIGGGSKEQGVESEKKQKAFIALEAGCSRACKVFKVRRAPVAA